MASVGNIFLNFLFIALYCNVCISAEYLCKANKAIGKCKLLHNCKTLKKAEFTTEELHNIDCSRSGLTGTVVCCPTIKRRATKRTTTTRTTTTRRTTTATPKRDAINRGLQLLNNHNCGVINDMRIAHGVNAEQGEFPWIAMLLDSAMKPFCDGSVITDRYILTAAHCIISDLQRVRLGEHKMSTIRDCTRKGCQTYKDFGIDPYQQPLIHPKFNSVSAHKDIALIKLNGAINFAVHRHIKPICLPIPPMISHVLPEDNLILAGWGLKENDQLVDVLQKAVMKIEELGRCKELYVRYGVDDSRLCIQAGANNSVSCHGDSGAPLMWQSEYFKGNLILKHYTQIGLVSNGYGNECGSLTSEPFMYENVTDSIQWIASSILY